MIAFLLPVWSVVKSIFGAILTFCSKPPGSWIALGLAVVFAIWLFGHYRYNQGLADQATADKAAIARVESNYQTCRENEATLQGALDRQNATIATGSAASQAALATAHQSLADAQKKAAALATKLAAFQAQAPAGATVCARVDDVDRRFLETLP